MYVDNTPVTGTGSRAPLLPNFDLERIEVLKGPQGSLYGEGSMGGRNPLHHQEAQPGRLQLCHPGAGRGTPPSPDDLGHRIDAMVNIPLGDKLAARITPFHRYKAGVIDKVGPSIIKDVDFVADQGYRAQLAFLSHRRADDHRNGLSYVYADIGGPGIAFPLLPRLASRRRQPRARRFPSGHTELSRPGWLRERPPTADTTVRRGDSRRAPTPSTSRTWPSPDFDDGGESDTWIYNLTGRDGSGLGQT